MSVFDSYKQALHKTAAKDDSKEAISNETTVSKGFLHNPRFRFEGNKMLTGAMLGEKASFRGDPSEEGVRKFLDRHKDAKNIMSSTHKHAIPLHISAGMPRPLHTLKRIWKRKDLSLAGKLIGTPTVIAALGGGDHYNSMAHSIALKTGSNPILAHEIGHAKDWSKRKHPTLHALAAKIPGNTLVKEHAASRHAMKMLSESPDYSKDDIRAASRKLHAAFGSYAGGAAAVGIGALAAHAARNTSDKAGRRREIRRKFDKETLLRKHFSAKELRARRGLRTVDKAVGHVVPKSVSNFVKNHKKGLGAAAVVGGIAAGHLIGKYRAKKWLKEHHTDQDIKRDGTKELT